MSAGRRAEGGEEPQSQQGGQCVSRILAGVAPRPMLTIDNACEGMGNARDEGGAHAAA